ncbi:hypothetical protein JNUCC64_26065 [Streptomyces sp. JNUCC 64]
MTNLRFRNPAPYEIEGSLAALRGEAARMVPHWTPDPRRAPGPVPPLHGVVVPAASARLVDAMATAPGYGGHRG